jgi:hypothetical protein
MAPPTISAPMNAGTELGAIPAYVLVRLRLIATAGLANDVEAVNPVGRPDPGADGPARVLQSACSRQRDNDQQQAGCCHDLAEEERLAGPVFVRWTQHSLADAVTILGPSAEEPVGTRHHRIELRAACRGEDQD